MKCQAFHSKQFQDKVAPVRERGLKYMTNVRSDVGTGRSRKGAWIEMFVVACYHPLAAVAPVRERGLKSLTGSSALLCKDGRSRKGAWIEIMPMVGDSGATSGRSRKGAWIEITD